jgi:hypothetical protein
VTLIIIDGITYFMDKTIRCRGAEGIAVTLLPNDRVTWDCLLTLDWVRDGQPGTVEVSCELTLMNDDGVLVADGPLTVVKDKFTPARL